MDCRTARMLLDFNRPRAAELEPADAQALETHLAGCPACEALADAERHFDDHVGRAMRHVEVPEGLRDRLLSKLDAERGDWYRRRFGHGLRVLAAAAAVLLLVWGWTLWRSLHLPAVTEESIAENVPQVLQSPDQADVQAYFKKMGVTMRAPDGLNYAKLMTPALVNFQGEQVPLLVFAHDDDLANVHARALVYVLPAKQFDLKRLPENRQFPVGSVYKVEIKESNDKRFAYVFVYTGESLGWLILPGSSAT